MLLVALQSLVLFQILSPSHLVENHFTFDNAQTEATSTVRAHEDKATTTTNGINRAVLVVASKGHENYTHQTDICHEYNILKKGGIKDEHIKVFMYDDITNYPVKGTLFNHRCGPDVYKIVPKVYNGEAENVGNLQAFILGSKKKVKGGNQNVNKKKHTPGEGLSQDEASLWSFYVQVAQAPEGSKKKAEAQKELNDVLAHRKHVDESIFKISQILFGEKEGPQILIKPKRPAGKRVESDSNDWLSLRKAYEMHCGYIGYYPTKYPDAFENMCISGVDKHQMAQAASQVCKSSSPPTHQ